MPRGSRADSQYGPTKARGVRMQGTHSCFGMVLLALLGSACATHRTTSTAPFLDRDLTNFDISEDFSLPITAMDLELASVMALERAKYGQRTDLYAASEQLIGIHPGDDRPSTAVEPELSEHDQSEIFVGFEPVLQAPERERHPTVAASTTRVVLYVKTEKAALRRERRPSSSLVRTLELGSSVLVSVEGDWARLGDEGYIALDDLSFKPIPKPKVTPAWVRFSAAERAERLLELRH